jgi:hypothetical protein
MQKFVTPFFHFSFSLRIFLLLGLWAGLAASGASEERIPRGGDPVAFDIPFSEWRAAGRNFRTMSVSPISVSNAPVSSCLEVSFPAASPGEYDLMLDGRISGQMKEDDALLLSFYARCEESSDESALGRMTIVGKAKDASQHELPFSKTYSVGAEWRRFLIPFKALADNSSGCHISFLFGGLKPQVLQIGGLELLNYGHREDVASLPVTQMGYPGMESDAPWRAIPGYSGLFA